MCSGTSEAVGTIWEHAQLEFQKFLKIRIPLLCDQFLLDWEYHRKFSGPAFGSPCLQTVESKTIECASVELIAAKVAVLMTHAWQWFPSEYDFNFVNGSLWKWCHVRSSCLWDFEHLKTQKITTGIARVEGVCLCRNVNQDKRNWQYWRIQTTFKLRQVNKISWPLLGRARIKGRIDLSTSLLLLEFDFGLTCFCNFV